MSKAGWDQFKAFTGMGLAYYQGDLNTSSFPIADLLNNSYIFGAGYEFTQRVGISMHYSRTTLTGSDFFTNDDDRVARGLSFESPLREFGISLQILNLTGKDTRFTTYLASGINYFSFNPTVTRIANSSINYAVESGYSKSGVNIPFTLGFGYWINSNLALVWETSLHSTFTDYIDGISSNGNPNYKDAYVDSHVMLVFRFGKWGGFGGKTQRGSRGFEMQKAGPIKCPENGKRKKRKKRR